MTATCDFTTGDGVRLAYRFDGPEQAPVLLLSNSLGTSLAMWNRQIDAFTRHFRVLRYDSRGHGRSGVPTGGYSMDRLGRDVIELLDGLGIAQASVCGVSKGGMVGQWLALRAPERVQRLAICNSSPYMGPPDGWDQRIGLVRASGTAALVDAVVERWFTVSYRAASGPGIAELAAMLRATDPAGYAGCCAAIRDMDMRPFLSLITAPTLVLGGRQDSATPPPHAELLASAIPGASLVMLDAAHLANVELPERFTEAVLAFLTMGRATA